MHVLSTKSNCQCLWATAKTLGNHLFLLFPVLVGCYTFTMKIAITGPDGLLGSNVTRMLVDNGHEVVAFVQPYKAIPTLEPLPIEIRRGDVLDPDSVLDGVKGCNAIIHIATNTSVWPSRSESVRKVNIEGTRNVLDAAEHFNVERLVYIGTANSFTFGSKNHPGDENTPFGAAHYKMDYIDSKRAAMELVLKRHVESRLPVILIHPTFMIGPYDSTPSSGQMLIRLYRRKVPGYTDGGKCWVHVHDVAQAITNSLSMGRLGESYIAGGYNLSYKEFFGIAADVMGIRAPTLRIPNSLTLLIGLMQSIVSTVTKRPPLLSYAMARIGCDGHYYDTNKAERELAMPKTDIRFAIEESIRWFEENGYLR